MPHSRIVWAVGVLLSLLIAPEFLLAQQAADKEPFGGPPVSRRVIQRNLTAARDMLWGGYLELGVDYLGMTRYAEAERNSIGPGSRREVRTQRPRLPESLAWLAQAQSHEGKYVEAEKLYRRTLGSTRRPSDRLMRRLATSSVPWARIRIRKGDYVEAERLYMQSLAMFEKTLGAKSPRVAQVLGHLATLNSSRAGSPRPSRSGSDPWRSTRGC